MAISVCNKLPESLEGIDIDRILYDYIKDMSNKELAFKYGVDYKEFLFIISMYEDKFVKYKNINKNKIISNYLDGIKIEDISNIFGVSENVVSYILEKEHLNCFLYSRFNKRRPVPYRKFYNNQELKLVSDLYNCGYTFSFLKKNFNISDTLVDEAIKSGSSSEIDFNDEFILYYQDIISKSYDMGIITNDMLLNLFLLKKEHVDSLKNDGIGYDSFLSNKLYQIYNCPYLMNKINFTDENILLQARKFLIYRYEEERKSLLESTTLKKEESDKLFKKYFDYSQNVKNLVKYDKASIK